MEIALVVPVLLLTAVAVIELAMILAINGLVAGGVREASRSVIPGEPVAEAVREERIVEAITKRTFGLLDPDDVTVTALVYPGFEQVGTAEPFVDANPVNGAYDPGEAFTDVNGNGQWDADMGADRPPRPGDVVVYTATVDWPVRTPLLDRLMGAEGGKVALAARLAILNGGLATASGE